MGFPLAVIPLISSSHVCKAKEVFLCACSSYNYHIVNLLINNWQLTKHIRPANICEIY